MSDERRLPGEPRSAGDPEPEQRRSTSERPPEGAPIPDRIGHPGPMGSPGGQSAPGGAGPAVESEERPGHPVIPSITEPGSTAGWEEPATDGWDPALIPDPADTNVPDGLRAAIESAMAKYPDRRSAVIPALHAAQDVHGWCSPEALRQVAAVMQVTPAYLSSIASFYDMLNESPVGRHHVYVCTGVACVPSNPKPVLESIREEAERTGLADTEVRNFECLGACDMAPMASVDGRYIGPLEPGDAAAIVEAIRAGEPPLPGRGLGDPEYRLPWGGRA